RSARRDAGGRAAHRGRPGPLVGGRGGRARPRAETRPWRPSVRGANAGARLQSDVARDAFLEQVITTVQRAENAYWNLVGARFRLRVAEESLALARQLHQNNRIGGGVGTRAALR